MDVIKFRFLTQSRIKKLPNSPGVYAFLGKKPARRAGGEFFYIGKAYNLRGRVKSHFDRPGYKNYLFLDRINKIGFIQTDSEVEALLLEAKLIKEKRPKYNVVWKDSKNYFFAAVTKEKLPRVFITHQPAKIFAPKKNRRASPKLKINYIGPFVDGKALKSVMKYLRRAFPYYTAKKHPQKPCLYCHLNLCPGVDPKKKEYQRNIRNLTGVLKGKRQFVLNNLKREMMKSSRERDFERAAKTRDQILAFNSIFDHAPLIEKTIGPEKKDWQETAQKLKKIIKTRRNIERIEAYDISNIQGKEATGSMVTFFRGRPDKNFYRKFKIRMEDKPNDVAMIKEILIRRLKHKEWPFPGLILIDGGKPQLNVAVSSKSQIPDSRKIKMVALAKRGNELFIEKREKPILLKNLPREIFNLISHLRDEAHRFARAYHHTLREKKMFG